VKFPGVDDDGLWEFYLPGLKRWDIQIESLSGMCPFIIEHNEMKSSTEAWQVPSVEEAIEKIVSYLQKVKERG
jgi:hypothetical protein